MDRYLTHKKISVVIACFNEAKNIPIMYQRLTAVFGVVTPNKEFIFVDNASTDESERIYEELCKKDADVSSIIMSRNFGSSDTSFSAGTEYASGDAVVWIDGDIQDPPELIEEFTKKWLQGYDVVYGVRAKRKINFLLGLAYRFFYQIFNRFSYIQMPLYAGDFCLIDAKVAKIISSFPERDRFMRGLRAWVGFRHTGIEYTRSARERGETTMNIGSYIRTAKKGLLSFSFAPVSLISNIAFLCATLLFLVILFYIGLAIFYPAPRGFLTILVIVLMISSIQFFVLAILGEYIGKIFEEVKQRPKYIIRKIYNKRS